MKAIREKRELKVYGQLGYKYQDTPTIMLKGKWLEEAGFDIGQPISVKVEHQVLTITLSQIKQ